MIQDIVNKLIPLAAQPDCDLAEGALYLACLEFPELEAQAFLKIIHHWADDIRAQFPPTDGDALRLKTLNGYFFNQLGFRGAIEDYYSPDNSFLNRVIETRRGIPITLSVLYISLARRVGLKVWPVGYPGHFLVKSLQDGEEIFLDIHGGGRIADWEVRRPLLERALGRDAVELPENLAVATPLDVYTRMLNNLKSVYLAARQFPRAIAVIKLLAALRPDNIRELRDLGVAQFASGDLSGAKATFSDYLVRWSDAPDAVQVRHLLEKVIQKIAERN